MIDTLVTVREILESGVAIWTYVDGRALDGERAQKARDLRRPHVRAVALVVEEDVPPDPRHPLDDALRTREAPETRAFCSGVARLWSVRSTSQNENAG
jgi:hypothetical protein